MTEAKPYTLCVPGSPRAVRPPTKTHERRVKTNPLPPAPSHRSTTKVPFSSAADAEAVCATLSVDNELQPDKVTKKLSVEGNELVA